MAEWYVDFSAGVDGSGTSLASPYNTLSGKTFGGGDRVWIRRNGFMSIAASFNFNQPVYYIGWPKPGDDYYDIRSAYATWDADSADYAEIRSPSGDYIAAFPNASNPNDALPAEVHRIKFNNTDTGTIGSGQIWVQVFRTLTFKNCFFTSYGRNTVEVSPGSLVGTNVQNNAEFHNCIFEVHHAGPGFFAGCCVDIPDRGSPLFVNCTFTCDDTNSAAINVSNGTFTKGAPSFFGCTIQSSTNYDYLVNLSCTSAEYFTFIDSIIDATGATGAHETWISTCKLYMLNTKVRCKQMKITNLAGPIHLSEFTQFGGATFGLYARGVGTINISNLSFGASNTNNVDRVNGIEFEINNGTYSGFTGERANVFIKDASALNDYHQYSLQGEVVKSSVYRTGNPYSYSMKMFANVSADILEPLYFGRPSRETSFIKLKPGTKTVTLYGAYKSYGVAPTLNDIWFEFEYYDTTGMHRAHVTTRATGALTSDSSTWNGDLGLTTFKIQTTVNVGRYGIMPVRVYLSKYDASGFVYIDPVLQVT